MGVSIKLYRVKKANKIEEVEDLERELKNAESNLVDLYKVFHDILMVLKNSSKEPPSKKVALISPQRGRHIC